MLANNGGNPLDIWAHFVLLRCIFVEATVACRVVSPIAILPSRDCASQHSVPRGMHQASSGHIHDSETPAILAALAPQGDVIVVATVAQV